MFETPTVREDGPVLRVFTSADPDYCILRVDLTLVDEPLRPSRC